MSKRSFQDLIELARPLLKEHGILSAPYLMRKLKINQAESEKIICNFKDRDKKKCDN